MHLENKIVKEFLARKSLSERNDSPSRASEKEREFFEGAAYQTPIDLSEWSKDVRSVTRARKNPRKNYAKPEEAILSFFPLLHKKARLFPRAACVTTSQLPRLIK